MKLRNILFHPVLCWSSNAWDRAVVSGHVGGRGRTCVLISKEALILVNIKFVICGNNLSFGREL